MSAHIDEIDEIDEIYDPGASPMPFSTFGLSGMSMGILPSVSDIHLSRVQLRIPENFVVPDRDNRDLPGRRLDMSPVPYSGAPEERDARDHAFDMESSMRDDFYRDSRALSELQHRDPRNFGGEEDEEELHEVPDTVAVVQVEEDDGSDPNAVHLWGRLPRGYRTIIVMVGTFLVLVLLIIGILFPVGGSTNSDTRVLYIQAERVEWDYLPSGADLMFGEDGPIPDAGKVYTTVSSTRIGTNYTKARYRRYTDGSFETPFQGKDEREQRLLGILGPTIFCQVGDKMVVHFRNNLTFTTSIHAQGVTYAKDSEAFAYGGDDRESQSPAVPPNSTRTYTWEIEETSGPEANDGLSVAYLYYPGQGVEADWNAGLIGMIVVTRSGGVQGDGTPIQTAANFPLLFATFDENRSPYLPQSAAAAFGEHWDHSLVADPDFQESNRMASVNGRAFANLPVIPITRGTYLQWYLASMSDGAPPSYVPHFHGNTFVVDSHRTDAIELTPGAVTVAEMRPPTAGVWLIRSATTLLYERGVTALYNVTDS